METTIRSTSCIIRARWMSKSSIMVIVTVTSCTALVLISSALSVVPEVEPIMTSRTARRVSFGRGSYAAGVLGSFGRCVSRTPCGLGRHRQRGSQSLGRQARFQLHQERPVSVGTAQVHIHQRRRCARAWRLPPPSIPVRVIVLVSPRLTWLPDARGHVNLSRVFIVFAAAQDKQACTSLDCPDERVSRRFVPLAVFPSDARLAARVQRPQRARPMISDPTALGQFIALHVLLCSPVFRVFAFENDRAALRPLQ